MTYNSDFIDACVDSMLTHLVNHENNFSILVPELQTGDADALGNYLLSRAIAKYNAKNNGDFIWFQLFKTEFSFGLSPLYLNCAISYYDSTTDRGVALNNVDTLINSSTSPYDSEIIKLKKMYLVVARSTTYDGNTDKNIVVYHTNSQTTIEQGGRCSISDTLVSEEANCQGIANTMYYIANHLGLECRTIQGFEYYKMGLYPHCWNIVKYNNLWYNLDATAACHVANDDPDATDADLLYWFMKNSSDFVKNAGDRTGYIPLANYQRRPWVNEHPKASSSLVFT